MEGLRPLILSRASAYAPHKYPVHYSGETLVSWSTLKTLPYFNSTASNLGLSWWSHDIKMVLKILNYMQDMYNMVHLVLFLDLVLSMVDIIKENLGSGMLKLKVL